MSESTIPNRAALINPTLQALHKLGGSGNNQEIHDQVAAILGLAEEQIAKPHVPGRRSPTRLAFRLGWARTDLKNYGLVDNSTRGVWALTAEGQQTTEVDGNAVRQAVDEIRKRELRQGSSSKPSDLAEEEDGMAAGHDGAVSDDWRGELSSALAEMTPAAFERLCQRILRESGFTQVEVTGRSGDGGIDGIGVLRLGGFLSIRVLFQCKRYKGSIGAGIVRDFRGAMVGRTDKGLIVTTGNFTPAAQREATRDGAPEIDLVDGEQLIDKLKELSLGVETEEVIVERVTVDPDFFNNI